MSPYKLTMNLNEDFSFSEFDELPDDGEFENIEEEAEELDFTDPNMKFDDIEGFTYEDDEQQPVSPIGKLDTGQSVHTD